MLLFVYTETTGKYNFDHAAGEKCQPHMVQVGALVMNDKREELACFHSLVRPRSKQGSNSPDWVVPAEAQNIHGISTEDCMRHGLPLPVVLDTIYAMAECAQVIVAHNIDFDINILATEFIREMREYPGVMKRRRYCTMKESTHIVGIPGRYGPKWPKLSEAYQFFLKKELQGAHDAMTYVRACAEIYFAMQERHAAHKHHDTDQRDQT